MTDTATARGLFQKPALHQTGWKTEIDANFDAADSLIGGFKNLLLNSVFAVSQYLNATVADDSYILDRWYGLVQTASVTASRLGPNIESGYNYGLRLTQAQASAQRFGFAQIIEGINCGHARGQNGVLSGRFRCSASTTLRYAILGWTGTVDTVTSDVVRDWTSATFTAGNFFLSSSLAVLGTGSKALTANTWANITALSAGLGTAFNNIVVFFWTDSTQAQNVTLDCDAAQFEIGTVASPQEVRSYSSELLLCQRYFYKNLISFLGYNNGPNTVGGNAALPAIMAYAPTISLYANGGTYAFSGAIVTLDSIYQAYGDVGSPNYNINLACSSGTTAGAYYVAHAGLQFSAEL